MKKRWKVVLILVAVVCFAISLSYPLKYKMEEKSTEAGMEKLIAMRDAGMAKRGERGDGRQEATVEEAGEEGAEETEPQAESERPEGTAPSDSEGEAEAESEPGEEAEAAEASAPESEPSEEAEATEPEADEAVEAAEEASEAAVAVRTEAEGEAPEAQAVMAAQEAPVEAEEPQGAAATQEQPGEEAEATEPSEATKPGEAVEPSGEAETTEPAEATEPSEEAEVAEPSEATESGEEAEAAEPSGEAEAAEPAEATEPNSETEAAEPAEASESAEVTVPSEAAKPGEEAESSESAESDESNAQPETLPVAQGEGAAQVLPGKTRQPVPTMDYGPTPIPTPTSMPTATPSPTATPVPTPTPNRFERTGAEPYAQKVKRTLDESKILPQFQEIYAENKDFAGWITIPDTVIDYPVVQTEDSDYYLHHDFFGDKNANGQIILDTKCDPYTPSYNLVISGHSMRSGKMFGRLVNYMDESYWEKHKLVYFDTLMDERTYVVMAAFFSADYDVDETGFRYNADIQYSVEAKQWLREIEENELYDTGIDAEFGDEFLTLTTCNKAHRSDGRFVVVCRRLRAGEEIE